MERLTADDVYKAAVPKSGQTIKWDAEVRGFGLRVTAGGAQVACHLVPGTPVDTELESDRARTG